ncbi:MAG: tetratricopeptide repeat protein [Candidatus Ozemobacteraceae bacterium]
MKFSRALSLGASAAFFLFSSLGPVDAERVGLIGEDLRVGEGLVVTVNTFSRQSSAGGLSVKEKEDIVETSITLVNTGKRPLTIDPAVDFHLKLDNSYSAGGEKGKISLDAPFTVHPGTQSRGVLLFRVKSDDTRAAPHILLKRGNDELDILCDDAMAKLLEKSRSATLDLEETLKVGRFFIDTERRSEAEKVLMAATTRFGDDPRLLLQMVAIMRGYGRQEDAQTWISRISPDANLSREDALALAREAYQLESYDLARKVLEPLANKGSLQDADLLFLGRCWYFDKQFERAEKLLLDLAARGMQDRQLFFTLGNICDKREDPKNAIIWWEKTMSIDPQHYEALFNIGVVAYKQGEKDRAAACWKRVLELNPDAETREIAEGALKQMQQ